MLIKEKDDCQKQITILEELLTRELPPETRARVETELKIFRSGVKGEASSAYYLDLEFKPAKNWLLIHDLRIEHNGDVAQIDHLLIGRMLDLYVIESKNYQEGVVISELGDFTTFHRRQPKPIESPIAQNERHIRVLDRFLTGNNLLPRRLGMTLKPSYYNIVLISPSSRLTKPGKGIFDCSAVMKADRFRERFDRDLNSESLESMLSIAKVISRESLHQLADKLVSAHKPRIPDYLAKFGVKELAALDQSAVANSQTQPVTTPVQATGDPICPKCGAGMVRRKAGKGKRAGQEFWGCSTFPKCWATVTDEPPVCQTGQADSSQ